MILTYRREGVAQPIEVEDSKDWAEVCNAVRERLYPGKTVDQTLDLKAQAIIAARQKANAEAARGASGVRDTSRAAYRKVQPTLNRQQGQLVEWLRANPGAHTRQEIAKATGWAINRICPRVKELLDLEVLAECSPRKCGSTGESARPIVLADAMEQAA